MILVGIEGSAAYSSHEEDSSLTQRIILVLTKRGGVMETTPNDIEDLKKRSQDNFWSKFNHNATHVVTQIEYGSHLVIEIIHQGLMIFHNIEQYFLRFNRVLFRKTKNIPD